MNYNRVIMKLYSLCTCGLAADIHTFILHKYKILRIKEFIAETVFVMKVKKASYFYILKISLGKY